MKKSFQLSICLLLLSITSIAQLNGFWGVTDEGGEANLGTIFKTDSLGLNPEVVYSLEAFDMNLQDKNNFVKNSANSFYVATNETRVNGNNSGIDNLSIMEYNVNTQTYRTILTETKKEVGSIHGRMELDGNGVYFAVSKNGGVNGNGVIWSWDPTEDSIRIRKEFPFSNPSMPSGNLVYLNNKFYGVCEKAANLFEPVAIFEYDPIASTIIQLESFSYNEQANVRESSGNVMLGSNGKLYGTTSHRPAISTLSATYSALFEYDFQLDSLRLIHRFDVASEGMDVKSNLVEPVPGIIYGTTNIGGASGLGCLFAYNIQTDMVVKKYDFINTSFGGNPIGNIDIKDDSLLYGVTNIGGLFNHGVIYEYNLSSSNYLVKSEFKEDSTGSINHSGLFHLDADRFVGFNSYCMYQFLSNKDSISTLELIDYGHLGENFTFALCEGGNGKLYGTTIGGGLYDQGVLFEFDPNLRLYNVIFNFDSIHGSAPKYSVILAADGNLYGTTSQGGAHDLGTIFKFDLTTNILTKMVDFDGLNGIEPLMLTAFDNQSLYGFTLHGASINSYLFELNTISGSFSIKQNFNASFGGSAYVQGKMIKVNNKLYGCSINTGRNSAGSIFEYDPITNTLINKISIDNGQGNQGNSPIGGLAKSGNFLIGLTERGGLNNGGVLYRYDYINNSLTVVRRDFSWHSRGKPFINGNTAYFLLDGVYSSVAKSTFAPGGSTNSYAILDNRIGTGARYGHLIGLDSCGYINSQLTKNNTTLFCQENLASYQWFNCQTGLPIQGEIRQSFTATINGDYAVIISKNGCVDTSACESILSVGSKEIPFSDRLNIYPNPTNGIIKIEGIKEVSIIRLYSVEGELLMKVKVGSNYQELKLNQPNGIYFLEIENESGMKYQKRIVRY
jgi:uncharacterized repeat protein (TIGR03803 family)